MDFNVAKGTTLKFNYLGYEYRVEFFRLGYEAGMWWMVAWDLDANDVGHFLLDDVINVRKYLY